MFPLIESSTNEPVSVVADTFVGVGMGFGLADGVGEGMELFVGGDEEAGVGDGLLVGKGDAVVSGFFPNKIELQRRGGKDPTGISCRTRA
jgi:hypothetical protein